MIGRQRMVLACSALAVGLSTYFASRSNLNKNPMISTSRRGHTLGHWPCMVSPTPKQFAPDDLLSKLRPVEKSQVIDAGTQCVMGKQGLACSIGADAAAVVADTLEEFGIHEENYGLDSNVLVIGKVPNRVIAKAITTTLNDRLRTIDSGRTHQSRSGTVSKKVWGTDGYYANAEQDLEISPYLEFRPAENMVSRERTAAVVILRTTLVLPKTFADSEKTHAPSPNVNEYPSRTPTTITVQSMRSNRKITKTI